MVRPCVLRHRVTVPTLCPLGEPEIAIGPEPRIEPWLPRNRIACQVSRAGGRCHYSKMNRGNGRAIQRRTSRAIESHQQIVGWISRQKISRLPAEGEPFLLTSPFIEPPISKCVEALTLSMTPDLCWCHDCACFDSHPLLRRPFLRADSTKLSAAIKQVCRSSLTTLSCTPGISNCVAVPCDSAAIASVNRR